MNKMCLKFKHIVIKIGINPFVGTKHVICLGIGKYESDNGLLYDKESGDVIAHYGDNRWYLVADSDELLVYNDCEK